MKPSEAKLHGNTYRLKEGDATNETSTVPSGPSRDTRPSLFRKRHNYNLDGYVIVVIHECEEDVTTRLPLSFFRIVSLQYETINGHTTMILAKTSTRSGMVRWFVRMAFLKVGRGYIQSRVSVSLQIHRSCRLRWRLSVPQNGWRGDN